MFLEAGEEEGRHQDFPGHAGTGDMNSKENICKKIVEIVTVSSMVFMLLSDYFYIQNKHKWQNMGIVWTVIVNTLFYKYFVSTQVCVTGIGLFFS